MASNNRHASSEMNHQSVTESIPFRRAGGVIEPSGSIWPNGEFSIGYAPCGGMEREMTPSERAKEWDAHLGLSLDSNSHSAKDEGAPRRGTKGLTAHGKKMVRNAVWRMQRLHGKKCLSFVTLTLPRVSFEESWYVSSNWAEICRVFYQKLARRLAARGLPAVVAGVTEMQPERRGREEHPALHLHFVVVGRRRSREHWYISPLEFREMWASVIRIYLRGERDFRACENVQMVRKDAASYMSKYLSKGVSMDVPPRGDETGWSLPTAWYNLSGNIRRWVNDNIRRHPELIESLERQVSVEGRKDYCHYYYSGVIEQMPGPGPHYHVGKLTGEALRELVDVWRAASLDSEGGWS